MPSPYHLKTIERQTIVAALRASWGFRGKQSQKMAARLLGISARVLNHKMKVLGIPRTKADAGKTTDDIQRQAARVRHDARQHDGRRPVLARNRAYVTSILESLGR